MAEPGSSWWGCARGPVMRLTPQVRIGIGAILLVSASAAPILDPAGFLVVGGATSSWLVLCWPPKRVSGLAAALALALFAPLLLLAPMTPAPAGATWAVRFAPLVSTCLHGVATLLVSFATVTSLSVPDLHRGLPRLPIPSVVTALILQMVYQSRALAEETRRVTAALAVRGATSRRGTGWQVARSLPSIWLPRVIQRAERVAAAMEVRGYAEHDPRAQPSEKLRTLDRVGLATAVAVLAVAVAARTWGMP